MSDSLPRTGPAHALTREDRIAALRQRNAPKTVAYLEQQLAEATAARLRAEELLNRSRDAVDHAVRLLKTRTGERDAATHELSELRAVIGQVDALAARHAYGAFRWADPLPVPAWVEELQQILAGHVPAFEDTGDRRDLIHQLWERAGLSSAHNPVDERNEEHG